MIRVSPLVAGLLVAFLAAAGRSAAAEQRFALIVTGASGGPDYATQFSRWSSELSDVLVERMQIPREHLVVLADVPDATRSATAANIRRALASLRQRMRREDLLLVVLIGHGTFDGVDAKFNLVGPDLGAAEWAGLLDGVPSRTVFVNTSSASFPFMEPLSGERRIVITATDSAAQRYDTVFAEYFIQAFRDDAGDVDKNGRISIWEAFIAATRSVRRHYLQRGQLSTERALLDDNGDGVGREATGQGEDGAAASRTYLDAPAPGAPATDEALVALLQQRATLELEADELKVRRAFLPPEEYQKEFERLMVALARVARQIRERTKS